MFRLITRRIRISRARYSTKQKYPESGVNGPDDGLPYTTTLETTMEGLFKRPFCHIFGFWFLHESTALMTIGLLMQQDEDRNQRDLLPRRALEEGTRYINKMRGYVGMQPLAEDSELMQRLSTSYAIMKSFAPFRFAVNVAMTPLVANVAIAPIVDILRRVVIRRIWRRR
ncbi:hypothetical protein H4R20_000128 [Coemansia guatemalensis]|uniref:Uncharacterized protein n=1 Tax=Coemansia guatemalensis TaxID=2761395 RepID=A0A9W8HZH9_9FUNG|nr:hypothetical protein H4R20_000128 [Coemansia guatemalensis]